MKNRVFIVLLILMAISACVSIPSQIKNSFEELSSLNSKQYLGGLNQQQLLLAEKIIKHMRPEFEWIQCPENNLMNGEIVGSFEVIDEPSNSFISNEDLQVLQSNISSGNQLVRDLSLYIVAKLGPAAEQILPWLKYFQNQDEYYSSWLNYALEEVGCQEWVEPKYKLPFPDTLSPDRKSFDVILYDMLDKQNLYPKGVMRTFISSYDMGNLSEEHILRIVDSIESSSTSIEQKAELLNTIYDIDLSKHEIDLSVFIPLLNKDPDRMDYYLESMFFNNRHPQGLKIIETGIQTGDFSNIGYLCEYGQAASHLEPELISYLNKTNNIMDIYGLVELLGCVGSKLSVKHLIALYNPNDWELQRLIIRTLKKIDPDKIYTEQFFAAALKSTWSEIIRKEITSDMEQLNCFYEESEDGAIVEFCEEPWSIKTRMGSGPNDHGMQKCVNVAEYSYDKESWFTVEWLESDHSIVPDGFPDFLLSERFKHSLLPLDNGWIFSSDHGHYGGSLYYWSGDLDSSYYILPWTDAFKVLKHQGRILALGYSILLSNTDGDLFEIKKDINDQWIAEIILNLPAEPNRYGYDLEGELLIADHWNHYGVKNNQITPLFCRGVKF